MFFLSHFYDIIEKISYERSKRMTYITTLVQGTINKDENLSGCGECQTSCQSACKTSCTVGNQDCENPNR